MPSTPDVRGLGRRYILVPTRRQINAKENKYTIARTDQTAAASTPVPPVAQGHGLMLGGGDGGPLSVGAALAV